MRPFIENFPFFSIFLAILAGILTATIRSGRAAYWVTIGVCAASAVLNAFVLEYTYLGDLSFTYTMGRFPRPLRQRHQVRAAAGAADHRVFPGDGDLPGWRTAGSLSGYPAAKAEALFRHGQYDPGVFAGADLYQ